MQALLIDDEIVAVNALKRRVDWSRYHVDQVFTAQSMQEAQEIFRQQKIDFMLCDIEMPNGSGLELFEWVKIYYPLTECVYVTCHPEYKYIRKALKLGSADYILKPIDYEELDEVLCELVKRLDKATENTEKIEKIPDESMQKLIFQNCHAGLFFEQPHQVLLIEVDLVGNCFHIDRFLNMLQDKLFCITDHLILLRMYILYSSRSENCSSVFSVQRV